MSELLANSRHRRPGREEKWNSTVCGLSKRDLLKDVLTILGVHLFL